LDFRAEFGYRFDVALLNEGGEAQPIGILGTSGVGEVDGAEITQATAAEAVEIVSQAKVPLLGPGVGFVMNAATWAILLCLSASGVPTGSKFLIQDGKMADYPVFVSEAMPDDTILFGNFPLGVAVATWGPDAISLSINPYTGGKSGLVSIVGHAFADIYVRYPEAFCKITSVTVEGA